MSYLHASSRNMNWTHIEVVNSVESIALFSVERKRGPLMKEKAECYSIRTHNIQKVQVSKLAYIPLWTRLLDAGVSCSGNERTESVSPT